MKKDKYLRERGGSAEIYIIFCAKCGMEIIHYQKDGIGFLHRCYLNRIIGPEKFAKLQNDETIKESKDMPNLKCDCGEIIGCPMKHKDNRLAFRLKRGKFKCIKLKQK